MLILGRKGSTTASGAGALDDEVQTTDDDGADDDEDERGAAADDDDDSVPCQFFTVFGQTLEEMVEEDKKNSVADQFSNNDDQAVKQERFDRIEGTATRVFIFTGFNCALSPMFPTNFKYQNKSYKTLNQAYLYRLMLFCRQTKDAASVNLKNKF